MTEEQIIAAPESTAISIEAEDAAAPPAVSPPVKVYYEGRWNHETNRAEWLHIEEPVEEITPKREEPPKLNHRGRRALRQATRQRARTLPRMCPECGAPFMEIRIPIYETDAEGQATDKVLRTVLWRCQCKVLCKATVDMGDEEEAEQA
jgi:hypothetical protein